MITAYKPLPPDAKLRLTNMNNYIHNLIEQGEHVRQDFKFEISDARKIAKTLSAFSNTEGGRLLVGVKDNGKIAGVRSEEEIYMIEAAAKLYCQPAVTCQMTTHCIEGRTVLEVFVPPGDQRPYYAIDENNSRRAYLRIHDENILATPVHLKIWQQEKRPHPAISINQYCRLARIPRPKAENILAKFTRIDLIEIIFEDHRFFFRSK